MLEQKTVVILGGTRPHAELAKYLKKKEYRTVLIDYLPQPIAKEFVDIHYQESSLDVEVVERISRQEHASYIMNICTDRAIPPAAFVAERMNLVHPYSYETALMATNKNKMKAVLKESGVPTSDFKPVTTVDDLDGLNLQFPLMVKPSDASGSIGISKVTGEKELEVAVSKALSLSRNHQAIVEEFVKGTEIQIDCFVLDGKVNVLDIKEKRKYTDEGFSLPYGSLIPARISEQTKVRSYEISQCISAALNMVNGPLYIQAIATENEVFVIEFGLRFGGGLSFRILKDMTGVDIIAATADAYLGEISCINIEKPELPVYATYHIFPKAGVFTNVTGIEKLTHDGSIDTFYVNKPFNMECTGNMSSSERIASFTVRARNYEENDRKLKHILQVIDVVDNYGNSIMRKDIYPQ